MKPKFAQRFPMLFLVLVLCTTGLLSSCDKEDQVVRPMLTSCERNDKYLFDRFWMWIQMDTAVCREFTVFHEDRIERISVFLADTIRKDVARYDWLTPCETFVYADSEEGITYRIQSVNKGRMILAQYRNGEFGRFVNFIGK